MQIHLLENSFPMNVELIEVYWQCLTEYYLVLWQFGGFLYDLYTLVKKMSCWTTDTVFNFTNFTLITSWLVFVQKTKSSNAPNISPISSVTLWELDLAFMIKSLGGTSKNILEQVHGSICKLGKNSPKTKHCVNAWCTMYVLDQQR